MKALLFASGVTAQGGTCETSVFETKEETIAYARRRGINRVAVVGEKVQELRLDAETGKGGDKE